MNLTTKQYYSRISGLLDAGLIKRHKGKYSLTMLGKVVYQSSDNRQNAHLSLETQGNRNN
jgi:predicted transcriptional regulator